jgi:hypothetical protein
MAPKITPKPQPRRGQADPGNEKPAADGASSSATAAPVPSPLRPAVTRLESIAGGPTVPGTAKTPLKYKPMGIARRTKEEREKAEREEQERLAARAVATPLATGAGRVGEGANQRVRGDPRRGVRGRGRGGALRGDRLQGAASGPFASASAAMGTISLATLRILLCTRTYWLTLLCIKGKRNISRKARGLTSPVLRLLLMLVIGSKLTKELLLDKVVVCP